MAGLLALVTPPPVSAIALGVALVAGAGALTLDFTEPQMREDLMSGHSEAWLTVGGDALSVLPGASGLAKTAWAGLKGIDDVGRMEEMLSTWTASAYDPGLVANLVSKGTDPALATVALNSTPDIAGTTYRILQVADMAKTPGIPSTAPAIAILTRAGGTVQKSAGLGGQE